MRVSLLKLLAAIAFVLTLPLTLRAEEAPVVGQAETIALADPFVTSYAREAEAATNAPTLVAAPSYNSLPRFETSASLLFLKPSSGSLEYGTLVYPFPAPAPHWENQAISPKYSPAFDVGLRYLVPETGNDLKTSWTHLDTTDTAAFAGDAITNFAGPSYLIGPGASNYNLANGSVSFRYDAVNLEAGHTWHSGRPFQVRMFGGLQYGNIRQVLSSTFADSGSTDSHSNVMKSKFAGVGPRFGVNAQYNRRNLQFVGDMAAVALIGTARTRYDFNTVSAMFPGGSAQSFTSPNSTQIVPGFDSRLGGAYSFRFGRGIVKLEGGYQAAIYLDAINSYTLTQVATPPVVGGVGVFFATAEHLQNNFMAHGPYLSSSFAF